MDEIKRFDGVVFKVGDTVKIKCANHEVVTNILKLDAPLIWYHHPDLGKLKAWIMDIEHCKISEKIKDKDQMFKVGDKVRVKKFEGAEFEFNHPLIVSNIRGHDNPKYDTMLEMKQYCHPEDQKRLKELMNWKFNIEYFHFDSANLEYHPDQYTSGPDLSLLPDRDYIGIDFDEIKED